LKGPHAQKPPQEAPKFLRQLFVDAHGEEEKAASDPDDVAAATAEIERTMNRVGLAFERGDVDVLEDSLAPRKIHISLKAQGEDAGYKGRPQIKFMFARLFDERHTERFEYDSSNIELARNESGARYVRAEWTYVLLDEDDVVTEPLRFGLVPTKAGWRVVEIVAGAR